MLNSKLIMCASRCHDRHDNTVRTSASCGIGRRELIYKRVFTSCRRRRRRSDHLRRHQTSGRHPRSVHRRRLRRCCVNWTCCHRHCDRHLTCCCCRCCRDPRPKTTTRTSPSDLSRSARLRCCRCCSCSPDTHYSSAAPTSRDPCATSETSPSSTRHEPNPTVQHQQRCLAPLTTSCQSRHWRAQRDRRSRVWQRAACAADTRASSASA